MHDQVTRVQRSNCNGMSVRSRQNTQGYHAPDVQDIEEILRKASFSHRSLQLYSRGVRIVLVVYSKRTVLCSVERVSHVVSPLTYHQRYVGL